MADSYKQGEAPWETGSSPNPHSFKQGEAPWETKKAQPQEIDEMHPDLSFTDRAIVKNFAQSPEAAAAYLNKQGFETEIKKNGDVMVRRPGEKSFKAVDPGFHPIDNPIGTLKDLPYDVSDIGYDALAGLGTGAASAASGLAGGTASGGAGAIPAAMAGGAATSSGLEAIRQKLGGYLGIPQEVSGKDVALAGAGGAIAPLMFGTGATASQIAKTAAARGLEQEAAQALAQSQRGVASRAIEKAFPYAARVTSGVPTEATKTYMSRTPEVDALIKEGPDAATNVAEGVTDKVKQTFFAKKQEVGQALAEGINGSENVIGRDKIFQPLEDRLTHMMNSERAQTPNGKAEILALRSEIDGMKSGLPENISPKTAWEIQDQLKEMADYGKVKGTFQARYGNNATGAEKIISDAAGKAYKIVNSELETAASSAGKKAEYSELSRLQDKLQKYFKDPETTERTLMQLDNKSKGFARKTVDEVDALGGPKVRDAADLLQSYSYYQKPELLPMSTGGTTSTSRSLGLSSIFRTIGGLGGEAGRSVGESVGSVAGGPAAVKAAIKTGKVLNKAGALPARVSPWEQMYLDSKERQ